MRTKSRSLSAAGSSMSAAPSSMTSRTLEARIAGLRKALHGGDICSTVTT